MPPECCVDWSTLQAEYIVKAVQWVGVFAHRLTGDELLAWAVRAGFLRRCPRHPARYATFWPYVLNPRTGVVHLKDVLGDEFLTQPFCNARPAQVEELLLARQQDVLRYCRCRSCFGRGRRTFY
jgi:hypothetical protein